jgi:hypothetical protein
MSTVHIKNHKNKNIIFVGVQDFYTVNDKIVICWNDKSSLEGFTLDEAKSTKGVEVYKYQSIIYNNPDNEIDYSLSKLKALSPTILIKYNIDIKNILLNNYKNFNPEEFREPINRINIDKYCI